MAKVKPAASPENVVSDEKLLLKRLARWAQKYRIISTEIAGLEKSKKELRDDSLAMLDRLSPETGPYGLTFTYAGGEALRVQRYEHHATEWDVKGLAKVLRERGLEKKILKIVVDEAALTKALEKGLIGLDEVQPYGEVETTFRFRVDPIKTEEE